MKRFLTKAICWNGEQNVFYVEYLIYIQIGKKCCIVCHNICETDTLVVFL